MNSRSKISRKNVKIISTKELNSLNKSILKRYKLNKQKQLK